MERVTKSARKVLRDWRPKSVVQQEVESELDFHIDCIVEELIEDGWDPIRAKIEANHRLGDQRELINQCVYERNPLLFTIEVTWFVLIIFPIALVSSLPWAIGSLLFDPD